MGSENIVETTFTFTNVTGTNVAPDTDTKIGLEGAISISIQVNAAVDSNHTATDWDLNIITATTINGTYDTTVYQEWNFGNDAIETKLLSTGPNFMKLRLDENGSDRADVTVVVTVNYR